MVESTKKLDPVSVRFDPDVKAALERLAKADGRSLSGYVNHVMRKHVEGEGRKAPKR